MAKQQARRTEQDFSANTRKKQFDRDRRKKSQTTPASDGTDTGFSPDLEGQGTGGADNTGVPTNKVEEDTATGTVLDVAAGGGQPSQTMFEDAGVNNLDDLFRFADRNAPTGQTAEEMINQQLATLGSGPVLNPGGHDLNAPANSPILGALDPTATLPNTPNDAGLGARNAAADAQPDPRVQINDPNAVQGAPITDPGGHLQSQSPPPSPDPTTDPRRPENDPGFSEGTGGVVVETPEVRDFTQFLEDTVLGPLIEALEAPSPFDTRRDEILKGRQSAAARSAAEARENFISAAGVTNRIDSPSFLANLAKLEEGADLNRLQIESDFGLEAARTDEAIRQSRLQQVANQIQPMFERTTAQLEQARRVQNDANALFAEREAAAQQAQQLELQQQMQLLSLGLQALGLPAGNVSSTLQGLSDAAGASGANAAELTASITELFQSPLFAGLIDEIGGLFSGAGQSDLLSGVGTAGTGAV